jgi:hypothetical protein
MNEWLLARKRGVVVLGHYGSGMHDFIIRECEVGWRIAMAEDAEMYDGPAFLYEEMELI